MATALRGAFRDGYGLRDLRADVSAGLVVGIDASEQAIGLARLHTAGDGADYNSVDWGQNGGSPGSPTPPNPCGDPPGAVGDTLEATTSLDTMLDEVIPWVEQAVDEGRI